MQLFYASDTWLIALSLFLLIIAVVALGRWHGKRNARASGSADFSFGIVAGAIFGLVSLLLSFSFSLGTSRFDARKQLDVQEANAIETTYLRSAFLGSQSEIEMRAMLRSYRDAGRHQASIVGFGLFVSSLNEMIGLAVSQKAAYGNRIPEAILLLLFVAVLIASAIIGVAGGRAGSRDMFTPIAFGMLVSLVIFTILDLDRPQRDLVRVNQDALHAARDTIRQ